MSPKQVIQHYGNGNVQEAARALKVSAAIIYHWIKEDHVPLGRQALIFRDTKGKLKISYK